MTRRSVVVLLALLLPGCGAPETTSRLAVTNVTVIDGSGAAPMPDQTVVVEDGRILSIGPSDQVDLGRAVRVDGSGAFLMPGLWDMHVHLASAGPEALGQFVANGVLGVRDLGGSLETVQRWRADIARGSRPGPRILAAGSIVEDAAWLDALAALPIPAIHEFLESNPRLGVTTVEQAQAAASELIGSGVDVIKIRNDPPKEAFLALTGAASEAGIPVVAHLPRRMGVLEAIDAGLGGIEHIDNLSGQVDALEPAARRQLIEDLAATGVPVTPTLVALVRETLDPAVGRAIVEDSLGILDPRRRHLTPDLLEFWRMQQALDEFDSPPDSSAVFLRYLSLVGELHDAGVPIITGTDLGARLVYPGESVHDELALLVEAAGLSPMDAIVAGTRQSAMAAGVADSLGVVRVGAPADFLLLDADPLTDIRNTRRIRAVVLGGRVLDRGQLAALRWADREEP